MIVESAPLECYHVYAVMSHYAPALFLCNKTNPNHSGRKNITPYARNDIDLHSIAQNPISTFVTFQNFLSLFRFRSLEIKSTRNRQP